ncbi:MAG: hypothetical protein DHS20C06_17330 [Hyphobacterium sp.]|nr:MAG: hypothetical protein DHS20C06_17330 [Hyphobacterium sp.]
MIWLRCRLGLQLGTGHAARCFSLAKAIASAGGSPGFILDSDAAGFTKRVATAGFDYVSIDPGAPLSEEADAYPDGPVVLDLSNPVMLPELSNLVAALRARDRKVALIEGLDHEAYQGPAQPDLVITPYLGAENEASRPATCWIGGGQYAVLGQEYSTAPTPLAHRNKVLVMLSGSDPWHLTEQVLTALPDFGPKVMLVLGGSIPHDRALKLAAAGEAIGAEIIEAPDSLHPYFMRACAAVIGPGLVKYEAVATRTPFVIVCPDGQFLGAQSAFLSAGLANCVDSASSDFKPALASALRAALAKTPATPAIIDGQGAQRLAAALIDAFGE